MALTPRVVSRRFPYLPVRLTVRQQVHAVEALLDTGFDGDIAIPPSMIPQGEPPDGYIAARLADGSGVYAPFFQAVVQVFPSDSFTVTALALGDEPVIGRGVSDRFAITLDHGQQVIVEP
jgi:predicted aspartyl protease